MKRIRDEKRREREQRRVAELERLAHLQNLILNSNLPEIIEPESISDVRDRNDRASPSMDSDGTDEDVPSRPVLAEALLENPAVPSPAMDENNDPNVPDDNNDYNLDEFLKF
ncbi:hypothetical protein QAD02_013592 [Eretmocerus hayati]|uniref:Uncharacterized protein n=2 Tax=Eretmocerus hayati TaxID=131215 RepID=A0ACC2P7R2_9HYME|nr:hypothetical protein QAD02_010825 [Eretmocerus hayati]KAJ8677805.1 hypothetical protein QAD02_013592 [Eretmocerus hayati]